MSLTRDETPGSDHLWESPENYTYLQCDFPELKKWHLEHKASEDLSYGVDASEYAGIGKAMYDPKYGRVPRGHRHFRGGAVPTFHTPVSELNRKFLVDKNSGFFAQPIGAVGFELCLANQKYNRNCRKNEVKKSLFPRSVVYDLDFIKNEYRKEMLANLDREREALEARKREKIKASREEKELSSSKIEFGPMQELDDNELRKERFSKPPFWYDKKEKRIFPESPCGDIDEGTEEQLLKMPEQVDFVANLKVDKRENYIPGEIYKNKKEPIDLTLHGECDPIWRPKHPDFCKNFDPSTVSDHNELSARVDAQDKLSLQDALRKHSSPTIDLSVLCASQNELRRRKEEEENKAKEEELVCKTCCTQRGCIHKLRRSREGACEGVEFQSVFPPHEEFDFPGEGVRYLPWYEQRQSQMFQCGFPFRTRLARWMEENIDPLPSTRATRSTVRKFPNWDISNL